MNHPLTLDELLDWLHKLRKGQEGSLQTNVLEISIEQSALFRTMKVHTTHEEIAITELENIES